MGKSVRATGRFDLRVVILRRVLGAVGDNNETAETWPDPDVPAEAVAAATAGAKGYFAARENLTTGETISQGIAQSVGFMKIRIKGRAIPVESVDRVKAKVTGKVYHIVGEPIRDSADTILNLELVRPQ